MQQAIHLLQLPIMELTTAIEQEMEQNPVLEYIGDDSEEAFKDPESDESADMTEEGSPEREVDFDEHKLEILKHLDDEYRDYLSDSEQFVPKRTRDEEKQKAYLESSIQASPSLFEHLMEQAREVFLNPGEMKIAETLLGHLDENGLLTTPLEEVANCFSIDKNKLQQVLAVIQTFDPVGVGAQDVREVLLIQLRAKNKQDTLAYKIIDRFYDDLLHNRLPMIQKGLKVSMEELHDVIQNEIAHLDLHPGTSYSQTEAPTLIPDVKLRQEGDVFIPDVNEDVLKPIRLNRKYLKMLDDPDTARETKDFIKSKVLSAKWLIKNIHQRNETLNRIAQFLGTWQKEFFQSTDGKLQPLTMRMLSEELGLHESTIARAVSHKYIETPRGLYPVRYFFSNAYIDTKGRDVSSKTIRDLLTELIDKEDKRHPLSDEALSHQISEHGIKCARRTIAKYRTELSIGNTQQRRKY